MSAKINVGGVETFSTVDFPEHMAAVVFLQGCPWRCPFCHNTSLQPIDAETDFVWEKFLGFLEKHDEAGYRKALEKHFAVYKIFMKRRIVNE